MRIKYLFIIISLLLLNCKQSKEKSKKDNLLKRKWMLVKLDTISRETLMKHKVHIDLTEKTNIGSAYAGCNNIRFTYTNNTPTINFTEIVSTEMYCNATNTIEDLLVKALTKSDKFIIKNPFLTLITKSKDTIKCVAEDWD